MGEPDERSTLVRSDMTVVLALLAAVAFAFGTVLQQRGTFEASDESGAGFFVRLVGRPVWLAGAVLQALGWVLQGAALASGSVLLVQSLTTLSLVIALPLGVWLTAQHVHRREIVGAAAVVAGIVLFLSAGTPTSGIDTPSAAAWWRAVIVTAALVLIIAAAGRTRQGATRAALFGAAAGVAFAFQATVTKMFVNEIGGGIAGLLTTWSTYALIATALVGFVYQQSALRTGVLASAMAASNAATLGFSVYFGISIFEETLGGQGARVGAAWCGLALAVVGVVRLASGSAEPEPAPAN